MTYGDVLKMSRRERLIFLELHRERMEAMNKNAR